MAYTKQEWVAREGVGLNKFKDSATDQILILTSEPDSITVEGTPFTADRMNHIENGIKSAHEVIDNLGTVSTEDIVPIAKGGTNNSGLVEAPDGAFIVKRIQTKDDVTTEFLGYTETIPFAKGGVSYDVRVNAPNNAIIKRLKNDTYDQLYYTPTQNGAFYATSENGAAVFGILPLAQGGVGTNALSTEAPAYSIIRKSSTSDNLWYQPTAAGVFQAEAANGAPKFDVVPIKFGGTGAADAATARTKLGITPDNIGAADLGANTFTGTQNIQTTGYHSYSITKTVGDEERQTTYYLNDSGEPLINTKATGSSSTDNYLYLAKEYSYFKKPLSITGGGTGATSASAAREALNAASLGANTYSGTQTVSTTGGNGWNITRTISDKPYSISSYVGASGGGLLVHRSDGTQDNSITMTSTGTEFQKNIVVEHSVEGSHSRVIARNSKGEEVRLYITDNTDGTANTGGLQLVNASGTATPILRYNFGEDRINSLNGISMSYSSGTLTINWMK